MISKILAFTSSDGTVHATLSAAQKSDLLLLMRDVTSNGAAVTELADFIVGNKEKFVDILTTTPSSKPRARKVNGGTKTRAPKKHVAEQFPLPMPSEDNTKPAA